MYNSAHSAVLVKGISWQKSNTIIITILVICIKVTMDLMLSKKQLFRVYMPIILIIFLPKLMMF